MSAKRAKVGLHGGVLLLSCVLLVLASAGARAEWEPENQDPFCLFADWQMWGDVCDAFLILSGGMACANNPHSCPGQCNVWGMPRLRTVPTVPGPGRSAKRVVAPALPAQRAVSTATTACR